ncbi:hypothetical protein [Clavibacter zhangzhiyongii]|uniref:hypothetical protein n=1 Tax=Clavibacter zhangzhiyongii TaxID=2768071 RepID=UPI0039E1BDF2
MIDPSAWTGFDDIQLQMSAMGFHHPLTSAFAFVNALNDPAQYAQALENLVTPESRDLWGDFIPVKEAYDSIPDPGYGSTINQIPGASDVGYFKILPSVPDNYQAEQETEVQVAAYLTLVWRPEIGHEDNPGMWLVHQFGEMATLEELVGVRSSANDAPVFM